MNETIDVFKEGLPFAGLSNDQWAVTLISVVLSDA
jgi:hypothetical protein